MKRIEDCKVLQYTWLNPDNFILELKAPGTLPPVFPGNFAQLRIDNSPDVFLRRPFSILDVDYKRNTISFYIKIIGNGTRMLGRLLQGSAVNIIYPLGNAFTMNPGARVLIVGGGTGIAPFIMLGRELQKEGTAITFLIGGRSDKDILLADLFSSYGQVLVTTEDGSRGVKGMVTDHPVFHNSTFPFDRVYTCGPGAMMKAVARIAMQHGIPCEASLENTMACGFGACLSCVVETRYGNKCTCTSGPVFNVSDVIW
jgi:dihydroorotate dehydrogenase electron transfer subunit